MYSPCSIQILPCSSLLTHFSLYDMRVAVFSSLHAARDVSSCRCMLSLFDRLICVRHPVFNIPRLSPLLSLIWPSVAHNVPLQYQLFAFSFEHDQVPEWLRPRFPSEKAWVRSPQRGVLCLSFFIVFIGNQSKPVIFRFLLNNSTSTALSGAILAPIIFSSMCAHDPCPRSRSTCI